MYCHDVFRSRTEFQNNTVLEIPAPRKEKRYRTAFTTEELNYLEQEYKNCPYSAQARLTAISNVIKKSEKVIKVWFQNRRSREKMTNNINEKHTDEKNKFDSITAKTKRRQNPTLNSSKNALQLADRIYQFPNQKCQYSGISEKKEINLGYCPKIELHSLNSCSEANHTMIKSQEGIIHNNTDITSFMERNVYNDNINRNNNINICKKKMSKIQNKMKPGSNILNYNNRQKLLNARGNSLAPFASARQQELLQNFNNNKNNKNITHLVDPKHHLPDNVSSMHKKARATEPQTNNNCKCKPVHEHRQKDLAIPYVIVIPCFK